MITNKRDRKEYFKKYFAKPENKKKRVIASSKYNLANKGKVKLYRKKHREGKGKSKVNSYSKEYARARRLKCLNFYGNNDPKCMCCGIKEKEFLALDHINGGGSKHRKALGGNIDMCMWIVKNNYPKNMFQILCHNCNQAKGFYGECPHMSSQSR